MNTRQVEKSDFSKSIMLMYREIKFIVLLLITPKTRQYECTGDCPIQSTVKICTLAANTAYLHVGIAGKDRFCMNFALHHRIEESNRMMVKRQKAPETSQQRKNVILSPFMWQYMFLYLHDIFIL